MKTCAKCQKTVYPTEELKCLDKMWHKACFRCTVCNMTLNMKNYKGFDKQPYCNAHTPTAKATVVESTPEIQRIKENTKIQSNIQYHEDFEKSKGKFTSVTDDPETRRILANTQKISNVKYHEEFEKNIRGTKTQVTDDPESERLRHVSHDQSNIAYRDVAGRNAQMEYQRQNITSGEPQQQHYPAPQHQAPPQQHQPPPPVMPQQPPAPPAPRGPIYRAMYDYTAADDDEVSFNDGDNIIDAVSIDEGWMEGTVQRTGQRGMLPANYVEVI